MLTIFACICDWQLGLACEASWVICSTAVRQTLLLNSSRLQTPGHILYINPCHFWAYKFLCRTSFLYTISRLHDSYRTKQRTQLRGLHRCKFTIKTRNWPDKQWGGEENILEQMLAVICSFPGQGFSDYNYLYYFIVERPCAALICCDFYNAEMITFIFN